MDNLQGIENTLMCLQKTPHSLIIDTLSFLRDVFKASFNLGFRMRKITSLTISLAAPPNPDTDLQIYWLSTLVEVLKCFVRGRNLEDLTLEIAGFNNVARAYFGAQLSSLRFRSLENFTSASITHDILADFIPHHPSLTKLDIGQTPCKEECPLQVAALVGLTCVSAAASCVSALVTGKPVFRACVIDSARTSTAKDIKAFTGIFRALRGTTMFLTRLDISFPATEMNILLLVASVAPQLVHLALVEVVDATEHSQRGRSSHRPWQHHQRWANQLKLMPRLSHFRLKTTLFVPPKKGSLPQIWFPRPRTLCETPEFVEVWHHDVRPRRDLRPPIEPRPRSGIRPRHDLAARPPINVRHLWSLGEDDIHYVYATIPGEDI